MLEKMLKVAISVLGLGVVLYGCSSNTTQVHESDMIRSLLLYDTCESPCWAGIQVGVTGFDEAKYLLQNRYGFDDLKVEHNSLKWNNSNLPDGVDAGSVMFGENKVSEIFLLIDGKSGFSVDDLLAIIGEPIKVGVSWGGPIELVKPCLGITLQYPNEGIMAFLNADNESKGVSENQSISILRITSIPDSGQFTVYDFVVVEWQGYKDYCQSIIESLP